MSWNDLLHWWKKIPMFVRLSALNSNCLPRLCKLPIRRTLTTWLRQSPPASLLGLWKCELNSFQTLVRCSKLPPMLILVLVLQFAKILNSIWNVRKYLTRFPWLNSAHSCFSLPTLIWRLRCMMLSLACSLLTTCTRCSQRSSSLLTQCQFPNMWSLFVVTSCTICYRNSSLHLVCRLKQSMWLNPSYMGRRSLALRSPVPAILLWKDNTTETPTRQASYFLPDPSMTTLMIATACLNDWKEIELITYEEYIITPQLLFKVCLILKDWTARLGTILSNPFLCCFEPDVWFIRDY